MWGDPAVLSPEGCGVLVVGGTEHLGRAGWILGTLDIFHFNSVLLKLIRGAGESSPEGGTSREARGSGRC